MATIEAIDWSRCDLVEGIPGKVSGAPLLKGTRLPVQAIVDNFADGLTVNEIASQFDAPVEQVRAILDYAERQRPTRKRPHDARTPGP
jgi:uncharacterized protein (DUF433 family)